MPAYDSQGAEILSGLSSAAEGLTAQLKELEALVGQGSLSMSLESFQGKLLECMEKWNTGAAGLEARLLMARTFLKGMVLTSVFSKDPVNLSTGNFYYEKEDLRLAGAVPLVWKRYYNAMDGGASCLGQGWSHTGGERVRQAGDGLILVQEDGRERALVHTAGEVFADAHTGVPVLWREGEGYVWKEEGKSALHFTAEGLPLYREDTAGNYIRYAHDGEGRLLSATVVPAGWSVATEGLPCLSFSYGPDGTLREAADHTGRKVRFFCVEGQLTEVTDPEGNVTSYRYGENGKLRAVKNARGILTVRNDYDEQGRVTRQRFPDRGEMRYEYRDAENCTVLTERNGSTITYVQDERLRNIRTIYHDGEERRTYNSRDLVTSRTDRNGNRTCYTYDDKGHLTGVVNALGEKISCTYNADGKLLCMKRQGKELVKNRYDAEGRLTRTTDAMGRSREYAYDERGLLTVLTEPDGSRTVFTYDGLGHLVSIEGPDGEKQEYTYDGAGRVVRFTDGNGNATACEYDGRDRLVRLTDAAGNCREYTYNESGKLSGMTDFDKTTIAIFYNSLNRPERIVDREGRETLRRYDRMWNLSEETSPSGAVTRLYYDADNRLERVELCREAGEAPETVYTYAHDRGGNMTEACAWQGTEWETYAGRREKGEVSEKGAGLLTRIRYVYDALNRPIAVTDGEGNTTCYAYDEMGNLVSITDPLGNVRGFAYNAAGECIRETDPMGNSIEYSYNAMGKVCLVKDAAGRETSYTYAPGGRLLRVTGPEGREISFLYDKNGNILCRRDSAGEKLFYSYDCLNRLTEVRGEDGIRNRYAYDCMGSLVSMEDAAGNRTSYEYTPSGRLSAVTDALGNRTEYGYDVLGNLSRICRKGRDGEERTESSTYDAFGHAVTVADAMGREEHYVYDALGRLSEKKDREGFVTTFRYNRAGKTTAVSYGDGTSALYSYDALQRLIRVQDWQGETGIERDALGRPVRITDHCGRSVCYEWGSMGERRSITYPDGQKAVYGYDSLLRPVSLRTEDGTEIRYAYDEAGRLAEKTFPDGLKTLWDYDSRGRLAGLTHMDEEGILDQFRYTYDRQGNRTGTERSRRGLPEESGSYGCRYDAIGRLIEVEKDGRKLRSYGYDAFGNRTSLENPIKGIHCVSVYNVLDQLVETGEQSEKESILREYRYDRRGNLVKELAGGSLLHGYEYDARNRLAAAWDREGRRATYRYNALGQRTGRSTGEREEEYLLDLTREYHNLLSMTAGKERQDFYWDGNAAILREKGTAGKGQEKTGFYLQDELGSPVRVRMPEGYLTYGYDEFGNDLSGESGTGIPSPYAVQGEEQPFGYTGYRKDAVSGTYFAQAREYQPQSGRFVAEDLVRGNGMIPKTLNRYGYCFGNPVGLVDLDGRKPQNINTNEIVSELYQELYESADRVWQDGWHNIQEEIDKILDYNVEVGTGIGSTIQAGPFDISFCLKNCIQVNERGEIDIKSAESLGIGLRDKIIIGENGEYSYIKEKGSIEGQEKIGNIIQFVVNDDGDFVWPMGTEVYAGIGGGVNATINCSELARVIFGLDESALKWRCDE